jgi:excisionase family DNA binding protein
MTANHPSLEIQAPQTSPDARSRPAASPSPTGPWLTYREAAAYTGWSVPYLRNLVSAGQIPVYGKLRVRRFRRDMLDLFLTDPDAAMRRFRAERNPHGG